MEAAHAAKTLFGCFRRGEANDPETYAAAVAAVLSLYSPEIVRKVTDPRSGLPSKMDFLPTVSEVRGACEAEAMHEAKIAEHKAQIERQLAARKEDFGPRPTLEELKAKHGPNWGLAAADGSSKREKERRAMFERANRTYFERECADAGVDPAGGVSPSLMKVLNA